MTPLPLTAPTLPYRALRPCVFLIVIQSLLLAYPSGSWLVPGLLSGLAISRLWTLRSGWCVRLPTMWNSLFLAMVFVLKFVLAPAEYSTDAPFINTELAHEIGCWLVSLQLLVLHDTDSLRRIPAKVGALGCLVVLCAGDVRLHSLSRGTMLVLMVLFVGGLGWFAHAGRESIRVDQKRRLRRVILAATILAACVPTLLAAQAWHEHERDLEQLLIRVMKALDGDRDDPRAISRSTMTEISNGRMHNPELVVLKVWQSNSDIYYLRGWCYDEFESSNWAMSRMPRGVLRNLPAVPANIITPRLVAEGGPWQAGTQLFPLRQATSPIWSTVEIQYLDKSEPLPFIPWETAELAMSVSELSIDSRQNLSLIEDALPDRIVAYVPATTAAEPESALEPALLQLPQRLDPRIRELANSTLQGCRTDRERIQAIERFFTSHFQYQLGFEPPRGQDAMTYFLLNRPAAHCEYFASGAALFLRIAGVPCRYVTGYVPSEYHADGFWLARRKDRHAWVEAFDRETGHWVNVEATPSTGVPEQRTADWHSQWSERWRVWSTEFLRRFRELGVLSAMGHVLQTTLVRVILVCLFLLAWFRIARKYRSGSKSKSQDPEARPQSDRRLTELESQLARHGLERLAGETLLQFAQRISGSPAASTLAPIADWYGIYGLLRYDEQGSSEDQANLDAAWKRIC